MNPWETNEDNWNEFMRTWRLRLAAALTENERKVECIVKATQNARWTDEQRMQGAASDRAMVRLLSKEAALRATCGGES